MAPSVPGFWLNLDDTESAGLFRQHSRIKRSQREPERECVYFKNVCTAKLQKSKQCGNGINTISRPME